MLVADNSSSKRYLFPGFDLTLGAMFKLNEQVVLRPEIFSKYYTFKDNVYSGVRDNIYLFDFSVSCLLAEKLWVGTSYRYKQAQTISVDFLLGKQLRIGYTYELGLGSGYYQYGSHAFRMGWNFIPGNPFMRIFAKNGKPGNSERYLSYEQSQLLYK